jgi:L-ascorbate metabolism protein UlaG (beta-lactamase superfamily)
MVISYYGAGMVKVVQGETTAVFNPIAESPNYKPVKFGADLALVSLKDKRYNGTDNAARGDRVPFVVDGPGEYEVGGIFIKGFGTAGPKEKINTVYSVVLEGTNLVHLGALSQEEIPAKIIEELGSIDVLFVPIGNDQMLSPKAAAKLATNLGSRLVIPVDYDSEDQLKTFLKEFGTDKPEVLESLTLKRKDILDKEGEVVVIKSF